MVGTLPSGHTYKELEGEEFEKLKQKYGVYVDGAIVADPGNFHFPKAFLRFAERFRNFEVRNTDIFLFTFPKSGTNWVQEIVWNLIHNPDLDNPEADVPVDVRCPFFEIDYFLLNPNYNFNPKGALLDKFNKLCPGIEIQDGFFCNLVKFSPDPRIIKDHLPYSFLPQDIFKKAKAIYTARDPRDVIVSGYHYLKLRKAVNFSGTFEVYVEDFINDKVYGSYWEHVRLGWEMRNHPNFLFLYYEDLKADPNGQIKRIDQFLGTNRTDKQIDNVAFCTSFDYMKEKTKHNQPTSFDNEGFKKEELEKGGGFFRKDDTLSVVYSKEPRDLVIGFERVRHPTKSNVQDLKEEILNLGKVGSWKEDLPLHLQEKINAWMDKNLARFDDDFKYKHKSN